MPPTTFPAVEPPPAAAADQPAPAADGLVVQGVSRSYGQRPVLQELDLTIPAGQSALVTGPNGAGKTTLLRVVAGVIDPHSGSVSVQGLGPDARRAERQRRIGFLPAGDRAIYARLTVRQNLDFWARIAFVAGKARRGAVDAALERFELAELEGRRADRLSTGQRQRARLAMAFLHEPGVVLLDEPGASLDEPGLAVLRSVLAEMLERGGAVLWCAPRADSALLPCDRVHVLADGRLESA